MCELTKLNGPTGLVEAGGNVLAEVTEWSYSESADEAERKTPMGVSVACSLHVGDAETGNTMFAGDAVITAREISNGAGGVTTIWSWSPSKMTVDDG